MITLTPQLAFGDGFSAYDADAFDLIALRRWSEVRINKQGLVTELGKVPIDASWATMCIDSRRTRERCLKQHRNMGVRLRRNQVVIDVDPRNFKANRDSFLALCRKFGLRPENWPRVVTGANGFHCYLALPSGVRIKESLCDFPGVEFKSAGRQVVAAGSRHPNGRYYKWSSEHPAILAELPMTPEVLLQAITRAPYAPRIGSDRGVYDAARLASMLAALDVEAFRDHADWLQLMFACHHATAGAGEEVFVRWSTSDVNYDDHDEIIAARWRSCGRRTQDIITHRTLHMILRKHGAGHLVPLSEDEFPDVARPRPMGNAKHPRVVGEVKS